MCSDTKEKRICLKDFWKRKMVQFRTTWKNRLHMHADTQMRIHLQLFCIWFLRCEFCIPLPFGYILFLDKSNLLPTLGRLEMYISRSFYFIPNLKFSEWKCVPSPNHEKIVKCFYFLERILNKVRTASFKSANCLKVSNTAWVLQKYLFWKPYPKNRFHEL